MFGSTDHPSCDTVLNTVLHSEGFLGLAIHASASLTVGIGALAESASLARLNAATRSLRFFLLQPIVRVTSVQADLSTLLQVIQVPSEDHSQIAQDEPEMLGPE